MDAYEWDRSYILCLRNAKWNMCSQVEKVCLNDFLLSDKEFMGSFLPVLRDQCEKGINHQQAQNLIRFYSLLDRMVWHSIPSLPRVNPKRKCVIFINELSFCAWHPGTIFAERLE